MTVVTTIILAFLGGVLATCMGALGSVILCAIFALAGVCAVMAGCEFNIVTSIAFGFFLSPHMGLGPAACALTYAAKKGYVEDSKGIALPLMFLGKPMVLVVGGIFAVISYYVNVGLGAILPGKIDSISAAIVVIGIIAKLLWGNEGLFGKVPEGDKRFGVLSSNNWMPHMPYGEGVTYWLFAGSVGAMSTLFYWYISEYAKQVGSETIASVAMFPMFALAVIFLILLVCGLPCPVFHHVGLSSCYAAMMAYAAGQSLLVCILWGMAGGIISHFAADLLADLFIVYGDGYVDPPSLSMTCCSIVYWIIFAPLGLYNGTAGIVVPVVLLILTMIFAVVVTNKRHAAMAAGKEAA